ncbi:FHA domain-containing protein [bacterium]|nr:FHA domain-containing protein [bacterium]
MPWMQIAASHLKGQVYEPDGPVITIGRSEDNAVCIPDSTVSGHHAVLRRQAEGYDLEDLESTNGTYVNGEPVSRVALGTVAKIQVGVIELLYIERAPATASEVPSPQARSVTAAAADDTNRRPTTPPVVVPVSAPAPAQRRFTPNEKSPLQIGSVLRKRRADGGRLVTVVPLEKK